MLGSHRADFLLLFDFKTVFENRASAALDKTVTVGALHVRIFPLRLVLAAQPKAIRALCQGLVIHQISTTLPDGAAGSQRPRLGSAGWQSP